MARNQMTYAGSTPCPCEDCDHVYYCLSQKKQCKVFAYWTTYGNILKRKNIPVEKEPNQIIA